jgi:hypothetical protein
MLVEVKMLLAIDAFERKSQGALDLVEVVHQRTFCGIVDCLVWGPKLGSCKDSLVRVVYALKTTDIVLRNSAVAQIA